MAQDIHGVSVIETPQLEAPAIPFPSLATGGLLVSLDPNVDLQEYLVDDEGEWVIYKTSATPTNLPAGYNATELGLKDGDRIPVLTEDDEGNLTVPVYNVFTKPADPMKPEGERVIGYNEPQLITKRVDVPSWMTTGEGTAKTALDAVFAKGNARVIVVPVEYASTFPTVTEDTTTVGTGAASDHLIGNEISGQVAPTLAAVDANAATFVAVKSDGTTGVKVDGTEHGEDIASFVFGSNFKGIDLIKKMYVGQSVEVKQALKTSPKNPGSFTVTKSEAGSDGKWIIGIDNSDFTANTDWGHSSAVSYYFLPTARDGEEETRTNAIGEASDKTGIYAMLNAKSIHNYAPRLLAAPGIDTASEVSDGKNPLGDAIDTVAKRLRGIGYIDSGTRLISEAKTRKSHFGSDRTVFLHPAVKAFEDGKVEIQDASGFIVGLTLWNDAVNGFWNPPSNELLSGVLGTEPPIDHEMGDASSEAQDLNNNQIATIVNIDGGYRFWGDYTTATGGRKTWQFTNVRRIADALYDSVASNHLWAVDRVITPTYLDVVAGGVNDLISDMVVQGALSGGICYPDPERNTKANISQGKVAFNVDFTPVYPARTVQFYIRLTTRYLQGIGA